MIGVLGAVFGAGIGVGSAIWNEECLGDNIEPTMDPIIDENSTFPELNFTLPDFTGTMPTGTFATELVTGTEPTTENGTEAITGTEGTATMETGPTGMRFKLCPIVPSVSKFSYSLPAELPVFRSQTSGSRGTS